VCVCVCVRVCGCAGVGGGGGGGCDVGFARAVKEKIYVGAGLVGGCGCGSDVHVRPEELFGAPSPRASSGPSGIRLRIPARYACDVSPV